MTIGYSPHQCKWSEWRGIDRRCDAGIATGKGCDAACRRIPDPHGTLPADDGCDSPGDLQAFMAPASLRRGRNRSRGSPLSTDTSPANG